MPSIGSIQRMTNDVTNTGKILVPVIARQFVMNFIFLYIRQLKRSLIKCFIFQICVGFLVLLLVVLKGNEVSSSDV